MSAPEPVAPRPSTPCPDENTVLRYLGGELPDDERARVLAHLGECDDCEEVVAGLVRLEVRPEPDVDAEVDALLARGANLGRYVVLNPVGHGSMGVVYAAYDPELDRKVALKLLRPARPWANPESPRPSLGAEAQAMARLSHPNILPVYDVGTHAGQLFFAMEFVRGRTLRQEVERAHSTRRILALYRAAGEGLSAAHAAGVIHRDFKPDNVLVGDDGRVRVTDFGLAALSGAVHGERAGTPAYMAPEQWRGDPADARSDQYAFCVALHEALFGVRPPPAVPPFVPPRSPQPPFTPPPSTLVGGTANPRHSQSRKLRHHVPPAVTRVIARGLRPTPSDRWPSMDALLHALSRASRPWSGVELTVAALVALLACALWAREAVTWYRAEHELATTLDRIPQQLASLHDLRALRIQAGLHNDAVMETFEHASDLDAALGLAPKDDSELELSDAHETLRSADLPGLKSEDALLVVNAWGRVLFNSGEPKRFGQAAPPVPLLVRTMEGTTGDALWSKRTLDALGMPLVREARADDLLWVTARPVVRGQSAVGAVLIGSWMRSTVLPQLEQTVGQQLVLVAPDGGWASRGCPPPELPADGMVRQVRCEGITYAAAGRALPGLEDRIPPGTLYVLHPLDRNGAFGVLTAQVRWAAMLLAIAALAFLWFRWWRYAGAR